jgi:hypothetical protein
LAWGLCVCAYDRRRGAPSSSLPRSQLRGLQADQEVHQHVQDAPCGTNKPRRQPIFPSPASSLSSVVRRRCLSSMPCRSALPRSRPPYASPRLSHMHAAVRFSALTAARLGIMIKGCRQRGVSVQGFRWCRKENLGQAANGCPSWHQRSARACGMQTHVCSRIVCCSEVRRASRGILRSGERAQILAYV